MNLQKLVTPVRHPGENRVSQSRHPDERRGPVLLKHLLFWIPAFAGMTLLIFDLFEPAKMTDPRQS